MMPGAGAVVPIAAWAAVVSSALAGQSSCPPQSISLERPFSLANERLGAAVSTSGPVLAAAAPGWGESGFLRGAVLVWRLNSSGTWVQENPLRVSTTQPNQPSAFAAALSCSGDRIAVGNPLDVETGGRVAGAVYIFRRTSTTGAWVPEQRIVNPGRGGNGEFGSALALDGNTLVVGPTSTGGDGSPRAAAHFVRNTTTGIWELRQFITPASSLAPWANGFATSIALIQARLAIGAPLEQAAPGDYRGAIHIFQLDGSLQFQPLVRVDGPPQTSALSFGDGFASSIAFDGSTVLVGAPHAMTNLVRTGAAYAFTQTTSPTEPWQMTANLRPTDLTRPGGFGASVALRGEWGIVGAPTTQLLYEYGSFTGCAELYARAGANWQARGRRAAFRPGPVGSDPERGIGTSVAITTGNSAEPLMVLGAPESLGGLEDAGAVDILPILPTIPDCNANALPDQCEIALSIARDLNFNGVPDICCPADIDGNQRVTVDDLFAFLSNYFLRTTRADINRIGGVTVQDVFDFIDSYLRGCR